MNPDLKPGITGRQALTVGHSDTAASYGSGLVEVFATPAMIALMEKTAQLSVQPLLPEGHITVGTEVNVTHIKASLPGMEIVCKTELLEADGRKLLFRVSASDRDGLIGEGTHRRVIVNAAGFMEKLTNPEKK